MTTPNNPQNIEIIDCKGMTCPDPLNLLRQKIRQLQSQQQICIYSDDPASLREIPAFCKFMGHTLIKAPETSNDYCYIIKKK